MRAYTELRKNISIDQKTWERLKLFGKFGESFDVLLNRLMDKLGPNQSDILATPKVSGEDGFNENEEVVYKGYFCKFVCKKDWDNFHDEQVFMNDEFIENAKALFNSTSQEGFLDALLEEDSKYLRFARRMLDDLVKRGLFKREEGVPHSGTTYWRTQKLKDLCPSILEYQLPVIDPLVEDYDKKHRVSKSRWKGH